MFKVSDDDDDDEYDNFYGSVHGTVVQHMPLQWCLDKNKSEMCMCTRGVHSNRSLFCDWGVYAKFQGKSGWYPWMKLKSQEEKWKLKQLLFLNETERSRNEVVWV